MIVVCGDFHGEFGSVNTFLNKHPEIDTILQCGDFGYWPKYPIRTTLKNKTTQIFWCDGNHEDHEAIKKIVDSGEIQPVFQNVFYMPRGTVLVLPDFRKVLFMGGGLSIDKAYRIPGKSWFPEETITQKDIMNLPDDDIDIVISHTAPTEFNVIDRHLEFMKDPSRDALSYVFKKYRPKLWYFGHMHLFKQGIYSGCKWTCLSGINLGQQWAIELEGK